MKKPKIFLSDEFQVNAMKYCFAFVAVLIIGAILILLQGENPMTALSLIIKGAFGTSVGFGSTIRYTMPCILLATSAAMAFKTGVYNLGLEGQFYFGSIVAAVLGYQLSLPIGIHLIVCLVGGGIAGLFWGLIPALLKLFCNVDELISSLMTNFIAVLLTEYITIWWIMGGKSASGSNSISTPSILPSAKLPTLIYGTSSNYGIFIAITIAICVYAFYKYTIKGYELKQVGENIRFARLGGVNIKSAFLGIFIVSGFLSGLTGAMEITGSYYRFTAAYAKSLGWNGIMIAMISNNNPLAIIIVSFIWGGLQAGSLNMERCTSLNKLTINILQMLFVLFVSIDYKALFERLKISKNRLLTNKEVVE